MAAGCGRRASWRRAHPAPLSRVPGRLSALRVRVPGKKGKLMFRLFYFPIANPLWQALRPWNRRVGRLGASTARERLPCQDQSSGGRCAPTCPACRIGKVPRPARGSRDDAPPLLFRRIPQPRSLHRYP